MTIRLSLALVLFLASVAHSQTRTPSSNSYVYAPASSEFRATFPGSPKIESVSANGTTGEWATLTTANAMLQAEQNAMSDVAVGGAVLSTDDDLKDGMLKIAQKNSYLTPTVNVVRTSLGRKVTMTGYKVIGGTRFRLEHQSYVGEKTIFTLIVAAPPTVFSTRLVQNFFGSIEANTAYVRSSSDYTYAPDGSEFTVTFPSKPSFRTVEFSAGVEEEASLTSGGSVLRSEFGVLSDRYMTAYKTASDSQLRSLFLSMAQENGYASPSVAVQTSNVGREVDMRGFKVISGVTMIYEHHMFFGTTSAITLVVAGPSNVFPTPTITRFLESIRRR